MTSYLPSDLSRNELVDQGLVIGYQTVHVRQVGRFRVEVKLVEFENPLQHLLVFVVAEMPVAAAGVPRVEGVIPDDVERLFWQQVVVGLENPVEVLVVTPRHDDVVQTTVLGVDAQLGVVFFVPHVGVVLEALDAEDDGRVGRAPDDVRVPHGRPLGFPPKGHDFADVVNQSS